ncbi:soluble epoxide hydrolase / lipid-phosphate phosphatase [Fistulifera solaris]|uniref:Soluble epoxide hydrolase / lipid-phosphate phosphatase n=1 Tax=Fistulifera solaris TaxID=1519565 RepID=A0A1Z5JN83_FISSO|nr:soluble epoxide hydrolase / lipid-phosphate phosphatase [Fistulifera solaris]|eukprot:GAX15312.1 soluble epoxide hydrolase / lipid-phosphate phosphatase [Fistulifera solaris]
MHCNSMRTLIAFSCFVISCQSFALLPTKHSIRKSMRQFSSPESPQPQPQQSNAVGMTAEDAANLSTTSTARMPPQVRRVYESFSWKYQGKQYNINYRVEGEGPPVLLIHGFGANVNHFRYQFPALVQAGYRVYAVDLLGFGASDKPANVPYSMELFAELLRDFIVAQKEKESWVVAGNSIGGLCSLMVAQLLPHAVRGLVLFNCSGGMTGFRYEDVPLWARPILFVVQKVFIQGPFFGPRFFENFRTRENVQTILSKNGVYGVNGVSNVDEELLEILLAPADDEGARDVFLSVFGGPPGPTPESILPTLQCPVLALWGQDDPWTPYNAGAHPATGRRTLPAR